MNNITNKIKGSYYGSAIGDGLGYTTEFATMEEIFDEFGPNGIIEPYGNPILVTDDTQMAIAVSYALMDCYNLEENITPKRFETKLRKYFIEWYNSPENNRAPGMTCMGSCENLEEGKDWVYATNKNSKGCGANMRVHPVAYFKFKNKNFTDVDVAKWSQFQAALTHAHPAALVAADLTSRTVVKLLEGTQPENLLEELMEYAQSQRKVYHKDFLGDVWERPSTYSAEEYIERGWEDGIIALENVKKALAQNDKTVDPCLITGEGWVADEAFATALLCFLFFPKNPTAVLRRGANSSGDSDSIACIAGAFAGAHCGIDAFPQDWVQRIEYQDELNEFISFLV